MIKIDQLSFSYSQKALFEKVSLEINASEYVAVIGPNGSGKSTLIKLIAGLLEPQSGSIQIDKNSCRIISVSTWQKVWLMYRRMWK